MLKRTLRLTAWLLIIACLVPFFSMISSLAAPGEEEDSTVMYAEKYVSVLYDNSGSMQNSDNRQFYAYYSLQMLASTMNNRDKLWVVPMSKLNATTATIENAIDFKFTDNREKDINDFVNANLKQSGQPLWPVGYTPLASIDVAAERLFKTDDIPGYAENGDRTRWLVILTDGIFTDENDREYDDKTALVEKLSEKLDEYPDMKVVYIGMGSAEDLSKDPDLKAYGPRFVGLKATADTVVGSMRDVSNMMSDRYTLQDIADDFITVAADKKSATVKLSYLKFPLNSISFSLQDFGGKVTKVTYSGKEIIPENCIITPPSKLGVASGATGVIRGTPQEPILFNTSDSIGDLVLYFDYFDQNAEGILKNNIVLMAEPALYIQPVFQLKDGNTWNEVTATEIMKNAAKGDKIRVGYRVFNGATNQPFKDLATDLPGETHATVFVNSKPVGGEFKTYSDEITLDVGDNKIKLNVSLMDGVYRLEKNVNVEIVGSTDGYEMTAVSTPDADDPAKSVTVFTPKRKDVPFGKTELEGYLTEISLINAAGDTVTVNAKAELQNDCTYKVALDLKGKDYGEYILKLTIEHPVYPYRMSAQATVSNYPAAIELTFDGADIIQKTETGFMQGQDKAFTFVLTADGKSFDFANGITDAPVLTFNGTTIPETTADGKLNYTINGNTLTFVPDKETVGELLATGPKDYSVVLSVSSTKRPNLKDDLTATLKITETTVEIVAVKNDKLPIDRFEIEDTPAEVFFAVYCDDRALTADELSVALGLKEKDDTTKTIGTLTVESDWCDNVFLPVNLSEPEVVELTVGGAKVACVKYVILPGHLGFFREHFTAWLIANGDKPITASYQNAAAKAELTTEFVLAKASAWSYIWRLLVILLWIHLILGFVLNRSVPRHPKGFFVCLDIGSTDSAKPRVKITPVNMTFMARAIPARWFIPFYPVLAQKAKGDDGNHMVFDFRHIEKGKNGKIGPLDKTVEKVVFKRDALIFPSAQLDGDAASIFVTYMRSCATQPNPTPANLAPKSFTNGQMRQLFAPVIEHEDLSAASNYVPQNGVCHRFSDKNVYAFYSGRTTSNGKKTFEKVQQVVFFVPKK